MPSRCDEAVSCSPSSGAPAPFFLVRLAKGSPSSLGVFVAGAVVSVVICLGRFGKNEMHVVPCPSEGGTLFYVKMFANCFARMVENFVHMCTYEKGAHEKVCFSAMIEICEPLSGNSFSAADSLQNSTKYQGRSVPKGVRFFLLAVCYTMPRRWSRAGYRTT